MAEAQPSAVAGVTRLVQFDRLRVIATGLILAYHCARPFVAFEPWHIKSYEVTTAFDYPMGIGSQFIMPTFWLVSGVGTWLALQALSPSGFLRRRLVRLLVPVVTVGWFVLSPLQVYVESTTRQPYQAPPFAGTFWDFLPRYLTSGLYGSGGWFPIAGLHLWYLFYLALFTLASMPLFGYLTGERGRRLTGVLAAAARRWWVLPLLGLSLVATEVLLPPGIPVLGWVDGGWRMATSWAFLVLGFLIGADARFREAAERQRRLFLLLAVVTLIPLLGWAPTMRELPWGAPDFVLQWSLRTLNGWLCLLVVLGYASRHLGQGSPLLAASSRLVLPFYILHQPVIVLLGLGVREWQLPIVAAYPLLVVATFLVCAAGCLIIRRSVLLRFLFGMSSPWPSLPSAATHQLA